MIHFNIRGENLEISPALRTSMEKKMGKISKYFQESMELSINVVLKVYNNEQKIEATIAVPKLLIRAEESHEDMYAAIDLVTDKLERQIRKHKTKINRKFREGERFFKRNIDIERLETNESGEEENSIIRKKMFFFKPMDADEAILQMEMLDHQFFVFQEAESEQISVVYKRNDGNYGLIQQEL